MTIRKRVALGLGATLVSLLITSMCATELTRAFARSKAEPPFPLPRSVDIRYSDALVGVIGKGTPTGRASAITLGYVIVVPASFRHLSLSARTRVIQHELVHVEQRRNHGRLYLPLYGLHYLLRGYTNHPFEHDARSRSPYLISEDLDALLEPW